MDRYRITHFPRNRHSLVTKLSVHKFSSATTSWYLGALHACVMMVGLVLLLVLVYIQQQPFHYTSSQLAFRTALDAQSVTSISQVWTWLREVTTRIGAKTIQEIEIFCHYENPHKQTVTINGKNYTLHDPTFQHENCWGAEYIAGDSPVYLSGNDQILSFGLFSERSPQQLSQHQTIGSNGRVPVRTDSPGPLTPSKDDKIVEVCWVPGSTGQFCVREDGFRGHPGSTFEWDGVKINGKFAFNETSVSNLFFAIHGMEAVRPCYTYEISDKGHYEVVPYDTTRHVDKENCSFYWVSNAVNVYAKCLDKVSHRQKTEIDSILPHYFDFPSYEVMVNVLFGCSIWKQMSAAELKLHYVEGPQMLRTYLSTHNAYGTFFNATNQFSWVMDSNSRLFVLEHHDFIDDNTRVFMVYTVTRNAGDNGLFYALIKTSFHIGTTGGISVRFDVVYSPMIQYYYGMDGHQWLFRDVFITEILFLICLGLFITRETKQLFSRVKQTWTNRREKMKVAADSDNDDAAGCSGPVGANKSSVEVSDRDDSSCGVMCHELVEDGRCSTLAPADEPSINDGVQSCDDSTGHFQTDGREFVVGRNDDNESSPRGRMLSFVNDVMMEYKPAVVDDVIELLPDDISWLDVFDWMAIAIFLMGVVYRVKYIQYTRRLHLFMADLDTLSPEGRRYDAHLEEVVARFSDIDNVHFSLRIVSLFAVLMGLVQFFKYISFDSRLAIFTSTISSSAQDLLPVLVIFTVVLIAYAVLGTEIYGQYIEDWSSLGKSLSSLVIMLLGEFGGYYEMREISPTETAIFFWSFVVIILFILLNMVLAVIFTVYDEKYDAIKKKSL